jgi:hypothetical protein
MQTFIDIVNEVLQFGFNDGPQVNRGRVKDWINEAQRRIARQVEAPEFQTNYLMTCVQGQQSYPLPADFSRIQDLVNPLYGYRLQGLDIQDFDLINYTAAVQTTPTRYCLNQFNVLLWPVPAYPDVLTMRYIAFPPPLVNDMDVPVLNNNYWDLLVTYGLLRAFASEDDYEASQFFTTQWKADLDAYATDVQNRSVDRPRVLDGTWGPRGGGGGSGRY